LLFLLLSKRHRDRANEVPSLRTFYLRLEMLLGVVILMGVCYGLAEHASWFDSIWLVWQTVTTVGYGDIPPRTYAGRTGVMICGIIGIVMLSYVVSAGLDYRDECKRRRKFGMENNPQTGSYLIVSCRDEKSLLTIINELRCVDTKAAICIVDDIIDSLPGRIAAMQGVHFVHGDILKAATYEQAGISSSKQVIFFPHQPALPVSDATTYTLVALAEELAPPHVPIIYFLVDPGNAERFSHMRAKAIPTDFAIHAAIQECQDPGSAEIFSTLMSNTHGANPTTFYPDKLIGWTWGELVNRVPHATKTMNQPINPLALIHQGRSNPCPNLDDIIAEGDSISLIVHRGFSYAAFEVEMAKISSKLP